MSGRALSFRRVAGTSYDAPLQCGTVVVFIEQLMADTSGERRTRAMHRSLAPMGLSLAQQGLCQMVLGYHAN